MVTYVLEASSQNIVPNVKAVAIVKSILVAVYGGLR